MALRGQILWINLIFHEARSWYHGIIPTLSSEGREQKWKQKSIFIVLAPD